MPDAATYLIHPSLMVRPDGVACLAYEWANAINVTRVIWNQDLVYNCREDSGWAREIVFDGYNDQQSNFVEIALNPSLVADACGNPHLAYWLGSVSDPGTKYATKGGPCVSSHRTVSLRVQPRTLNLKSNGRWVSTRITVLNVSVADVDASSLALNGVPLSWSTEDNGCLVAKFDRAAFAATLTVGTNVVTLAGWWRDGSAFTATDIVLVIPSGK